MSGTRVNLIRQPVSFDTGTKYQISAQCTAPGTLPDIYVFVFSVTQPEDPKNDTFLRIADVADFLAYGISREASISKGTNVYRSATITLNYDDVVTANGAWQELSSRLNTLVSTYDTYLTAFLTSASGTEIIYPAADTSTKNALIAAYRSAVAEVTKAEAARDTEQVACDALQLELQTLQGQLTNLNTDIASVTPLVSTVGYLAVNFPAIYAGVSSAKDAIRAVNTASAATAGDRNTIETQVQQIESRLYVFLQSDTALATELQSPLTAFLGTLQARLAALIVQIDAKQTEVNACLVECATLQGTVDLTRQRRDGALASIRAVCPDFNPATDTTDVGLLPGEIPLILGG